MPLLKQPLSCHEICIKNIADNMHTFWSKDSKNYLEQKIKFDYIVGPFEKLSEQSVTEIFRALIKEKRMSKACLQILIVSQLTEIDFSKCDKFVNNPILDLVINKCVKVRKLKLDGCKQLSQIKLISAIETFGKTLEYLDISNISTVTNEVLVAIGKHCTRLRHLEINNLKKITVEGIYALLFVNGVNGETTKLASTLLTLGIFEFDLDESDSKKNRYTEPVIFIILRACKNLCVMAPFLFWNVVRKMSKNPNCPPLAFRGARFETPINLRDFDGDANEMGKMIRQVPHLQSLCLQQTGINDDHLIHSIFTNVQGSVITSLYLDWGYTLHSFLHIAPYCPNLKELDLHLDDQCGDYPYDPRLQSDEKIWLKLNRVSLSMCQHRNNPRNCDAVKKLMDSAPLTCFKISFWMDEAVNNLFLWAINNQCFETMEYLEITECRALELSVLWEIVMENKKLKYFRTSTSNEIPIDEFWELEQYTCKNNFAIKLEDQNDHSNWC